MPTYLKKLGSHVLPRSVDVLKDYLRVRWLSPRMRQLKWEPFEDGPIERVEPACVMLGHELYVFAGYQSLDRTIRAVDIEDRVLPAREHGAWLSDRERRWRIAGGRSRRFPGAVRIEQVRRSAIDYSFLAGK